tara:strand:+ start:1813 stop:1947 length:135 start_codon:yes stop_codon:yes gene_type:complete
MHFGEPPERRWNTANKNTGELLAERRAFRLESKALEALCGTGPD